MNVRLESCLRYALLLSTLLLGACASGNKSPEVQAGPQGWIEASPILRQQIADEAARLPWTHGFERLEQIRWFASVGEPAYPMLLELSGDPRDDVAAAALASLGATGDRRLVPAIKDIPWPESRQGSDLGLERARTLVRLGDWSAMPTLIGGLRDARLYTRSLCLATLDEATNETHGFDPRASETEREKAVLRWEEWWLARTGEGLVRGR